MDGTRGGSFFLGYQKSSDRWAFWGHHYDKDNTTATVITSTTAPSLNTWTHLVGVYDVVNSRLELYVNGYRVASATYTQGWQATGPLVIGREKWNGGTQSFWKGRLDDVRVYSGVVTNPAFLMM